jgi:NAD(P)H-hydrate repair Nnr-like enzyme with NAD(P)H-hydrate epimerase domain
MHIEAIKDLPDALKDHFQLVLDGIFGYSFKGDIRAPFDTLIPVRITKYSYFSHFWKY